MGKLIVEFGNVTGLLNRSQNGPILNLITHINVGVHRGRAVAMPQKNLTTLEIQAFREACVELEKMLVDLKSGVEGLETL